MNRRSLILSLIACAAAPMLPLSAAEIATRQHLAELVRAVNSIQSLTRHRTQTWPDEPLIMSNGYELQEWVAMARRAGAIP